MIQKKRILAAALSAALMAGTLAGCGAPPRAMTKPPTAKRFRFSIGTSTVKTRAAPRCQEFIDTFNASQDEIEVEGRFNASYDELLKNLQADTAAGNAPSIVPGVLVQH